MMLRRVQNGGVEERLRDSQYGFRRGRGTSQAMFMAARLIDQANARKNGQLTVVLLDWSRAFDKIDSKSMMEALGRFGLQSEFVEIVAGS